MTFYFLFSFNVIADKNMYRAMIYVVNFYNPFFSLLLNIRNIFWIYNINLSNLCQIHTSFYKLYHLDNDFWIYQTLSFWVILKCIDQVLSFF